MIMDTVIEDLCKNCGEETYTPDDRTGLIHKHGRYVCHTMVRKNDRLVEVALKTVAE